MPPSRYLIAVYFWVNIVTDVLVWFIPFFYDPSKYVSQISSPVPDPPIPDPPVPDQPVPVLPAPYEPGTGIMTYVAHPLITLAQPTTPIPTDYYVPKLEPIPTQTIEPLCGPSVYFEHIFDAIKSTDILCPKGTPFLECLFGGNGEFRKSLIEFITFYWGVFRKNLIDYVSKVNGYYLCGVVFLVYFLWTLIYWQKSTYPRSPLIPPTLLHEPSADLCDSDNEEIFEEIREAYNLQEESFWDMIKREFMQLMPKLQKPPNLEFIVPETGNSGENPSNPPTTDKNNDDEDPSSSNPPTTDNERSSSSNPPTTDNNNGNKRPSSSAPPTTDNEHPPSSKPPTTENVNGPSSQQAPDDKHPSPPTLGNGTTEIIDGTLNQEGDQEGPDDSRAPSPPKAKSILRRHIRRAKRPYLSYSKALKKSGTQKGPSPSVFNKPPHLLTQSLRSANDADMALMASLSPRTKAFVLQAASGNVQRSLNEHYEQLLSLGLVSIEETRPDIQLPGRTTFRRFARHFQ